MQPHPALQVWLDDPERQSSGKQGTQAAKTRLDALPPIAAFRTAISGLGDKDCARIGAAIETLFSNTDWVDALVEDWVTEAGKDPFFVPPFRPAKGSFHHNALLIEEPQVTISLCAIDPAALAARKSSGEGRGSVFFSGKHTFLKFLGAGGMRLSLWEVGAHASDPCTQTAMRQVAPGTMLSIDMARHSYIFEEADRPVLFLHGEVRMGGALLAREYDVRSRQLIGHSSGADNWSRAQLMLSYLAQTGHRDAAAAFDRQLSEAPFFVRWHLMREWIACDRAGAHPRLAEMARSDDHAEVRRAAKQALTMLDGCRDGEAIPVCP